jgi:ACR3 family arsenite efflux pump ArsB
MLLVNQAIAQPVKASGGLGTFERYLSVWVALCMAGGVVIRQADAGGCRESARFELAKETRLMRLSPC